MRFSQAKRISFLLVAVLATASVVSSLSIPQKLNADLVLVDLAKRAPPPPAKGELATSSAANKDTRRVASNTPNSPRPNPNPASATSAPPAASSSAISSSHASSSSAPHESAPPSNSTAASQSNNLNATQTGPSLAATGTGSPAPVPTGGLSTPAVGGIAAVGCVALVGAGIFAVMRYKRKASLTQNLGTKSINQFSGASPYGAPAPFASGANTGYERLSDPQLSGALAPVGAPSPQQQQQSLGTYTVISTYTPTLGDELEIQPGDKVTLLVEYDDGWCQGVNESRGRVKGVFPKHCVDYGNNQGGMEDMEKSKRVSSMYGAGGYRM